MLDANRCHMGTVVLNIFDRHALLDSETMRKLGRKIPRMPVASQELRRLTIEEFFHGFLIFREGQVADFIEYGRRPGDRRGRPTFQVGSQRNNSVFRLPWNCYIYHKIYILSLLGDPF